MDTQGVINSLFGVPRALVGVVHTVGLPGTPAGDRSTDEILETAVAEARLYASAGFHGVMIENTHDRPYLKGSVGPEIVAALAVIGREVRRAATVPLGVPTLVGSGVTLNNLHDYLEADALIVGSSIKHGGVWSGSIDQSRARELARAFKRS